MNRSARWGLALSSAMLLGGVGLSATPAKAATVRMLSTGVGIEERVPHKDYPLLVEFARARGALLADVKVTVTDGAGKPVLTTVSSGPWLYLGLPAGDYKVIATPEHRRPETASMNVPASGQKVVRMTW